MKVLTIFTLPLLLLVSLAAPAVLTQPANEFGPAQRANRLQGDWVAVSSRTRGLTRLSIAANGELYRVEVWGRCRAQDCKWPMTVFTPLGKSVDETWFTTGFAEWNAGFAKKYLLFSLDRRLLRVETVTIFGKRSRRSSYSSVEYLRRADG